MNSLSKLLFTAWLGWSALVVQAAEVAGIHFEDRIRAGEHTLLLNGAGVRSKFLFKVYAIGLYLPAQQTNPVATLAQPGPKRIRIVTLRDVEADMFINGLSSGIANNHGAAELANLQPRMEQLKNQLRSHSEIAKGSEVTLDLLPDNQTRLSINGATPGKAIPGEDFYRALLSIWLGHSPVQDDLKQAMLGKR